MFSLKKRLIKKDNNYSRFEKSFKTKTGTSFINGNPDRISINKSCSIIIPFYKNYSFFKENLIALQRQELPKSNVEIIVVNDGFSVDLDRIIDKTAKVYPITYLKLKKNYGRAAARNLGLIYAKNDIVIFLDEDIVAPKDFFLNHLIRHNFCDSCVVVGLRENISIKDLSHCNRQPNFKKDFRYKKFIPNNWKNVYRNVPEDHFGRWCFPMKESDYFKKFGKERIVGIWTLPWMFIACNVSIPRKDIFKVGGFDTRFKGWGMEDVHLGAKLIASGLYLVPNLTTTVYHLIHELSVEETRDRAEEFTRNRELFNQLKKEPFIIFSEGEWKKKVKKHFANKFTIKYFE
ncbi:MAG: glycosyltransferase [bacterium]|nr:glycosyltransferase [bacterium]